MTNPNPVLVIIPTFNEAENLAPILARLHQAVPAAHALVVDDASPDGTGQLADELARADDRTHVLHRSHKEGLGAAYLAGFTWALTRDYQVIVEMDADGSHRPEELPGILAALSGVDVVLGSRWVPGGSTVNWARSRRLLSRAGNRYARASLRLPLRDMTGGYRAYHRRVLTTIPLADISSQGYCFQIDMIRRAASAGHHIVEVPIEFVERAHGSSKMSSAIVVEALLSLTRWGIDERRHRTPDRQPAHRVPACAAARFDRAVEPVIPGRVGSRR